MKNGSGADRTYRYRLAATPRCASGRQRAWRRRVDRAHAMLTPIARRATETLYARQSKRLYDDDVGNDAARMVAGASYPSVVAVPVVVGRKKNCRESVFF